MAETVWTEPALSDRDAIADYLALYKLEAARRLVQRVYAHVERLSDHPKSGSVPREVRGSRYRQIVKLRCRVFYRYDGGESLSFTSSAEKGSCASAAFANVTGEPGPVSPCRSHPGNWSGWTHAHLRVYGNWSGWTHAHLRV